MSRSSSKTAPAPRRMNFCHNAPALAAASVGIAMGAVASDAALETADIAVMGDDLARLPYLYSLARRSRRVIRENIAAPAIRAQMRKPIAQGGHDGDEYDWVISEDMLPAAETDAEALQWLDAAEVVLGNTGDPTVATELWRCVHLCTINMKPSLGLSKTFAQWQALRPAHSWADSQARTILRGT